MQSHRELEYQHKGAGDTICGNYSGHENAMEVTGLTCKPGPDKHAKHLLPMLFTPLTRHELTC